jgi:uncharacterized protein DUF922
MKVILQFLLITFPLFSFTGKEFIDWNTDRKLTWDDFKAAPDMNSRNAALTASAIQFNFTYDGQLKYSITCQFNKNKSWGKVKTDYILSHEQGHFDITEIFARTLNKSLKEYTIDNIKTLSRDLNKIYENTMHQLNKMQNTYDNETNFSINKEKQEEWLVKISKELKELNAYANYPH